MVDQPDALGEGGPELGRRSAEVADLDKGRREVRCEQEATPPACYCRRARADDWERAYHGWDWHLAYDDIGESQAAGQAVGQGKHDVDGEW